MRSTQELITHLRQKPEHIRHRIVLGTSIGVTALIGIIWITAMATSGTLALKSGYGSDASGSSETPSSDAFALTGTNVKSNFSELVGAVGAVTGATTSKPALKIIDGSTSSSFDQSAQQPANANPSATVIPF